jgi:predicted phosphoribosyltransferase
MFTDRRDAGSKLADRLGQYAGRDDVVVLGLPRGGVPVAAEVASALGTKLDVFVVRKLGVPGHEELAMGAVASGGTRVLNDEVLAQAEVSTAALERVTEDEQAEVARRDESYRAGREPVPLAGCTAIVVDDGLATGATMRAALAAVRATGPARTVAAVPVAPAVVLQTLQADADEVVFVQAPQLFLSVGQHYRDFAPTTDDDVRALLAQR